MSSDRAIQDAPCVLTLIRPESPGQALEIPARWRRLCAPSAYEAAAEILAGHVEVLVVDFSLLGRRHLKLLEIARDMGTHVLALGSTRETTFVPVPSGVHLATWSDLPAMLRQLAQTLPETLDAEPGPAAAEAPPPVTETPAQKGTYEPAEIPAPGVTLAPAKKNQDPRTSGDSELAVEHSADVPEPHPAPPTPASNMTPEKLLTAEELEALLRDKP